MPIQPTRSDVHVNRPLTNISIAYMQKADSFIADKVFPNVPVQKQSDLYFSYDKRYWFQTQAQVRGPGTESAGSGFKINPNNNYFAALWAVHKDLDDQIRQNADINLDIATTNFVTQQLLLRREKVFVSRYLQSGIWTGAGGDFTPSVKWDTTNSTPISDIETLKQQVESQTGFAPNTLVLGPRLYASLKNNISIIDRIKYTQRGLITEDLLAGLFGVDRVLVARATQDLSPEGSEVASMSYLVNNAGLLCYSAPAPSLMEPSAGYTFSWTGYFGAGNGGNRIMSFRMEHLKSDRIEGEMAFDMKQIGSDLGVYITGALSS